MRAGQGLPNVSLRDLLLHQWSRNPGWGGDKGIQCGFAYGLSDAELNWGTTLKHGTKSSLKGMVNRRYIEVAPCNRDSFHGSATLLQASPTTWFPVGFLPRSYIAVSELY